jgi:hypothetical protein
MKRMENSTIRFRTAYGYTEKIIIQRGVPQGDNLSPLLYLMAIDLLHKGLEKNPLHGDKNDGYPFTKGKVSSTRAIHIPENDDLKIGSKGYADDVACITDSIEGLRRMTDWINTFCDHYQLTINTSKTHMFGRNEKGEELANDPTMKKNTWIINQSAW